MVAQSPTQAASLKKMLADGHQLASHTYTHGNLDTMTEAAMRSEISRTSDIMFEHGGVRPAYMRAPEGRCGELCTKVMTELGLVISHWNVDTNDWRYTALKAADATEKSMIEINQVIVQSSVPTTDSFVLLEHEIHAFSVDFLAERVIDAVLAKGYKFVTMEECIGKPSYLAGSTVPPTTPVVPPTTNGTAPIVPPASTTAAPVAPSTGAAKPSGSVSSPAGSTPSNSSKNQNSGAGLVQVGAWAMGLAAAVGYALF
jgi:hypothetical protein